MTKIVPNVFPTINNQPYRLAIVGEAPGQQEEILGRPFVGPSGKLLDSLLASNGILRNACYVGNVCQVRPPANNIAAFSWDGPELAAGRQQLFTDLQAFKPNLILCLGATALHAIRGERLSIDDWRGSLFVSPLGKAMGTYHPSNVLRVYENLFPMRCDIRKARRQAESPHTNLPVRRLLAHISPHEIIDNLRDIQQRKPKIALDIEGYVDRMTCMSIATSAEYAFIIPTNNYFWPEELEHVMWRELALVMADPDIPKVLQNAMYDLFVLQWSYKMPVVGLSDDTMLKHWELLCEAPKSLGFQASIYTDEPYWKDEREDEDQHVRWEYCCKDSAVTYEINETLSRQLVGTPKDHYDLNVKLLEPLLYMEHKGILYDSAKAKARHAELMAQAHRLQWTLDRIAFGGNEGYTHDEWIELVADYCCFKKERHLVFSLDDILKHSKTTCLHIATRAVELLKQSSLSLADQGELGSLIETSLNVESKNQIADFLYRDLCLPIQYKKEKGRLTDKETTDVLALLNLYKKTNDKTLKLILTIRALRTRADVLRAETDSDNRIRCGYNIVGTETGRLSCYESPTGSGFNLQTVTKKDRDLFLPDPGYWLFQCDLSGADGWTVAAHCKACGDPTMFDDYLFGLKPAKLISLMYLGIDVNHKTREELASLSKGIIDGKATELNPYNWLYFGSKRIQHGSNYGMKKNTMSDQILKDSYKLYGEPIFIEPSTCEQLQQNYLRRYPGVLSWHERIKRQIKQYGYLISANGHKRQFLGRRDDYDTFKQACADEPQNNTTFATNLAMWKLWSDGDNRITDATIANGLNMGRGLLSTMRTQLRIQPLHQVHDALIGQFRKEDTSWAVAKIKSYFDNVVTIAGTPLTIPFEGAYGESWGNLSVGSI